MTGAFVRVERKGKMENIEVEHLEPDELDEIIGSRSKAEIMDWLSMTLSVIRLAETSINKMEEAMDEFVYRVEQGEVRSVYTYNKFKDILHGETKQKENQDDK